MRNNDQLNQHTKNVQNETGNPAILNDVIDNGFEQYPEHNEKRTNNRPLSSIQEVARNNMDGKTWQNTEH
ncbi:hypothetical protein [Lentibacillus salicampi]|uniref:DUF4025 domain-containing protein n=1 Tax=Lentibacillus salicampi TaxID=175306 RepID=A0A4Y9AIB8_9BACI|nr:hypothetical protein [Lentibacillus salicampi]TFJ94161.1 hypothetical protein E4U82_02575 [Lentibacillus salicampi]